MQQLLDREDAWGTESAKISHNSAVPLVGIAGPKYETGFTVLEGLFAASFILLFWFTIFTIFGTVRQGLSLSENHFNTALLGKNLLEDIISTGVDNVSSSAGQTTLSGISNGAPIYRTISYNVNVQALSATKKRVWVILNWQETSGTKQVVLETILVK